jgi:hypothetical protein
MAAPADPGAAFEVVEAEAGLQLAVVVFDAPPAFRQMDQVAQGRIGGQVAQPVVAGFVLAGRPLHEQATGGLNRTARLAGRATPRSHSVKDRARSAETDRTVSSRTLRVAVYVTLADNAGPQ